MVPTARDGEVVTVILLSGARLVGEYRRSGSAYVGGPETVGVGDWTVDADKIQAWRLGDHPFRKTASRRGE